MWCVAIACAATIFSVSHSLHLIPSLSLSLSLSMLVMAFVLILCHYLSAICFDFQTCSTRTEVQHHHVLLGGNGTASSSSESFQLLFLVTSNILMSSYPVTFSSFFTALILYFEFLEIWRNGTSFSFYLLLNCLWLMKLEIHELLFLLLLLFISWIMIRCRQLLVSCFVWFLFLFIFSICCSTQKCFSWVSNKC